MLIITGAVFYGYVFRQKSTMQKCYGVLLALSLFSWFVCDFLWGIQTQILHINPDKCVITEYGYTLTNIFLFLAIALAAYHDLKKMNKIQALLDALVVSIYAIVLLWLFVFDQSIDKILVIKSAPVAMFSLILDILIYAWINIWFFSTRIIKPPLYHRLVAIGSLIYVCVDLIYYYYYFYSTYEPNSWIDGAYTLAFSFIGLSVIAKKRFNSPISTKHTDYRGTFKWGFEIILLLVPILIFLFERRLYQYSIQLGIVLLIYYILNNVNQKSIFQAKLLELEKKNVSELEIQVEKRTEEIIKLLNTDFLTGLYSRRYFDLKLIEEINFINKDEQIAVLYLDQNKSKTIKYLYGKNTSEKLLKKLSQAIKDKADNYKGIIAAYESDVFVIMLKGSAVDVAAEKLGEEIISLCNDLFYVDKHAIRVTLNIGISCYPRDTSSANDLIKNADLAMLQARTRGFNQIQQYDEQLGNVTYSRQIIEMKLKTVSFDKEFQLYYQPQVNCANGELCGFESLIRWHESDNNIISPLDFIPIAEEIGLIVPLGYWIMETAAKQYAQWKRVTGKSIRVSVNVSSKQLIEEDFLQRLQAILDKYEIEPEMFEIEITESYQIENSINVLEILNKVKELGVSIAIDDFGTGYSSLYYIKNIPTDRLKIAKELVDNIENDEYSNVIIQMAISVAKVKGIKIIAEGVETKEQFTCLKELGCDEIQGYYFSKPYPADEIEKVWFK